MAADGGDQLNLRVVGQDGAEILFKIKQTTPFRKLINAYCDRQKLAANTIRFVFDGTRIQETDTPKSMDMEDGDAIEVFSQQTGGDNRTVVSELSETVLWAKKCSRASNLKILSS